MSWIRLRFAISHEGWSYLLIAAFILVGAIFRDNNLLILLVGMMMGPFLFNWRMASLAVRRLEVARHLPARICAGELLTVELTARGPKLPFGVWAVSIQDSVRRDSESGGEEPARVMLLLARVPAGGLGRASYRCLLTRRGRYQFGPFVVSTRFPFGLVRGQRTIESEQALLVCPRLGRLTAAFSEAVDSERAGSRQAQPRRGLVDGDYYALREWRSGDSLRWIHWRTSAKQNELTVREFEEQRHRDVAMVIDLWRPRKAKDEDLGRVELALSFAATVVAEISRHGSRQFSMAVAGDEAFTLSGPASPLLAQQFLNRLATIQATATPALEEAVPQLLANLRGDSRLIVVTTNPRRAERVRVETSGRSTSDRHAHRLVHDALWLDVSTDDFSRFFQID